MEQDAAKTQVTLEGNPHLVNAQASTRLAQDMSLASQLAQQQRQTSLLTHAHHQVEMNLDEKKKSRLTKNLPIVEGVRLKLSVLAVAGLLAVKDVRLEPSVEPAEGPLAVQPDHL